MINDITGQKFGKLTAIEKIETKNKYEIWKFKCDCGLEKNLIKNNVLCYNGTTSCGCETKRERLFELNGKKQSIKAWAKELNINYNTLYHRLQKYSFEQSIDFKIKPGKINNHFNLKDKKFGKLTVIRFLCSNKKSVKWLCKCDCGNEVETSSRRLLYGGTKSCGCLYKIIGTHKNTGYYDIKDSYINSLRIGALQRGLDFKVSNQYLWELFLQQNKKCRFTNLTIVLKTQSNDVKFTASLDRIDSSRGYIEGNVQWVHKKLNFMKRNMSDKEFIQWCKLVANNNPAY